MLLIWHDLKGTVYIYMVGAMQEKDKILIIPFVTPRCRECILQVEQKCTTTYKMKMMSEGSFINDNDAKQMNTNAENIQNLNLIMTPKC